MSPKPGKLTRHLVGRKLFHDLAAPEYLMPAIAAPRAALGCGPIAFRLGDDRGREHAFDAPGVGVGQFAGNIQRRPRKGGISGEGCAALGDAARVALLPLLKGAERQFAHEGARRRGLIAAVLAAVERGGHEQFQILAGTGAGDVHEAAFLFEVFGPHQRVARGEAVLDQIKQDDGVPFQPF